MDTKDCVTFKVIVGQKDNSSSSNSIRETELELDIQSLVDMTISDNTLLELASTDEYNLEIYDRTVISKNTEWVFLKSVNNNDNFESVMIVNRL